MSVWPITLSSFLLVSLCAFVDFSNGYLMPICSDYCGTCTDQCKEDDTENVQITKTAELFFFVTDTMEVVRKILYYKILPFFIYQKRKPRDLSYVDSMWSLFGFHVQAEPPADEEYSFCNGSIFALIFVLYFGYLFMATKCVKQPEEDARFIPYLMPNPDDDADNASEKRICCHHGTEISREDDMCLLPYDIPFDMHESEEQ